LEEYKTIKELADELNTNKTKIFRIIKSKQIETTQKQNKFYLDESAQTLIKKEFKNEAQQTKRNENETSGANDILIEELKRAHEANKELIKLLDQQQQLTLQSNKQIEKLQNQLALLAPKTEDEDKAEAKEEPITEEKTPMKEQPKKKTPFKFDSVGPRKKWWQLWK